MRWNGVTTRDRIRSKSVTAISNNIVEPPVVFVHSIANPQEVEWFRLARRKGEDWVWEPKVPSSMETSSSCLQRLVDWSRSNPSLVATTALDAPPVQFRSIGDIFGGRMMGVTSHVVAVVTAMDRTKQIRKFNSKKRQRTSTNAGTVVSLQGNPSDPPGTLFLEDTTGSTIRNKCQQSLATQSPIVLRHVQVQPATHHRHHDDDAVVLVLTPESTARDATDTEIAMLHDVSSSSSSTLQLLTPFESQSGGDARTTMGSIEDISFPGDHSLRYSLCQKDGSDQVKEMLRRLARVPTMCCNLSIRVVPSQAVLRVAASASIVNTMCGGILLGCVGESIAVDLLRGLLMDRVVLRWTLQSPASVEQTTENSTDDRNLLTVQAVALPEL